MANENSIPQEIDAITADWLTEILQDQYPGVEVASVQVAHRAQVTNAHARLNLTYRTSQGAPTSMFAKLLPSGQRREAIAATMMGPKELRFYRDLAPNLPLRVPQFQGGRHDSSDDSFVLLLEDLNVSNCEVSNGVRGVTANEAAGALEDLAAFHVRFEDQQRRAAEAGWVNEPVFGSTYGSTMLQFALDTHRDRLSNDFAEISRIYIDSGARLHEIWTAGPRTVIHGDTHIGNVFFDGGTVGFLDWGIINVTTFMREVSYFMTMAMDIEERRRDQEQLLRHYLEVRRSLGGIELSFDDAWMAHRIHGAYCVVASCQVVTFPADATEQRKIFSAAFLQRAEAAIEDLESLEALQIAY